MRNRSFDMEERLSSNTRESLMDFTFRAMQTLPSYAHESRRYADEPWTVKKGAQDLARVRSFLESNPKSEAIHLDGPALRHEEYDLVPQLQGITRFEYVSRIFNNLSSTHAQFISLAYELEQAHRDLRLRMPFGSQKTPESINTSRSTRSGILLRKVEQVLNLRERERQYFRARQRFTDEVSFQRLTFILRQAIIDERSPVRILDEFEREFKRIIALLRKILRSFGLPPVDVAGEFARFQYHLEVLEEALSESMIIARIGT